MSGAVPTTTLSAFYLAYFAYVGAYSPYFGLYLQSIGHDAAAIGLLLSAQQVMRIVAPNLWAAIADRTGRRAHWIRLALAGGLVCMGGLFLTSAFWPLFVFLALIGFFTNAALPLFETLTFAHLKDDLGRYGRIRLWGSIGFVLAVMGVGALLDLLSIEALLWISMLPLAGALLVSLAVPDAIVNRHAQAALPIWPVLRQPAVMALFGACFLNCMAHGPLYNFYSIHLTDHGYGKTAVGVLWSIGVVAEILLFLVMPRLLKRWHASQIFAASFAFGTLRFVLIGWGADQVWLMVLAQLMHAATFGAYHAAALGMVNTWFPDSMRSRGQALYMSLSFGAGGMIGGIGSGFLWQSVGPGWTLTGSSLVCLLGLVLALRSGSAPAREQT